MAAKKQAVSIDVSEGEGDGGACCLALLPSFLSFRLRLLYLRGGVPMGQREERFCKQPERLQKRKGLEVVIGLQAVIAFVLGVEIGDDLNDFFGIIYDGEQIQVICRDVVFLAQHHFLQPLF